MKIVLDSIVKDKGKYAVYVQLQEDGGKVLANALVHYEEGAPEELKLAAIAKFRAKAIAHINKEAKRVAVKAELEAALATINIAQEVM